MDLYSEATGVWPIDAERVLKRFNNRTSRQDHDSEPEYSSGSDTTPQLVSLREASVADGAKECTKGLLRRVEALQVKNKLPREEDVGLQEVLNTKKEAQDEAQYSKFSTARGVPKRRSFLFSKEGP